MTRNTQKKAVMLMLLIVGILVGSFAAQPVAGQATKDVSKLLGDALKQLDAALKLAVGASNAADAKSLNGYSCTVLYTIEGQAPNNAPHPGCSPGGSDYPVGLNSYVLQIQTALSQSPGHDDFVQTFRNMLTYLSKASNLTKGALSKLAASELRIEEAKTDMQIVLGLLSAVKGRPDDPFSYGGLLTLQASATGK